MTSNGSFVSSGSSPTRPEQIPHDFLVQDQGTIFLLTPLTPLATFWLENHVGQGNGFQPYRPTCVIEHRFIFAVVEGISDDGLVVQIAGTNGA
jgi:hypothetical protein